MGLLISRFRRKKTTSEILERLETKIKSIEQDGECQKQSRKRIIGYVISYSVGIYVLFAILYYFMYVGKSHSWLHSVLHASPLLVLPILAIFLRSAVLWYYNWSIDKNRIKLAEMRAEKKKLLEEVMNTETYKVAKEILDKYGGADDHSKALRPFVPSANVPGNGNMSLAILPSSPLSATPGQLRQRQQNALATSTPKNYNSAFALNNMPSLKTTRLRSDQLPRPLLDKNRSALDKVVDYLLKDGPNQRMALICTQCSSHNGMAMVEEFDYVSYICAYCGKLNPSRKQRPAAPLLSPRALLSPKVKFSGAGDDSSVASSGSDSDEDKKPHLNNVSSSNVVSPTSSESDRSASPVTAVPKSESEKKQD